MKNALKYWCGAFTIMILLLFCVNNNVFINQNASAETPNVSSKKEKVDKSTKKDPIEEVIHDIYNKRCNVFVTGNLDSLHQYFDTTRNVGKWSLEHEIQRVKYLKHWSYQRGITFTNVSSKIILNKKHPGKNRIKLALKELYKFDYIYTEDEHPLTNSFGVGILHTVTLVKKIDRYVIESDWYTDCFEDALKAYSGEVSKWDFSNDKMLPLPNCPKQLQDSYPGRYKRLKAVAYADKYCGASLEDDINYKYNLKYMNFNGIGGDCTNFASQVLGDKEGGELPFDGAWRCDCHKHGKGEGSRAWVNADGFRSYLLYSGKGHLIKRGTFNQLALPTKNNPNPDVSNLYPGDLICYAKGHDIDHFAVVTSWDSHGYPLINSHTTDRYHVPWDLGWGDKNIFFHLIHVR